MILYSHANKTIVIRQVVPLASFWKWGFLELGSHWPIYQGAFDVVHLSLSWPWQLSFDSLVFGNVFSKTYVVVMTSLYVMWQSIWAVSLTELYRPKVARKKKKSGSWFTSASFRIVPRTFTNLIMILSKLRKNGKKLIKYNKIKTWMITSSHSCTWFWAKTTRRKDN